jgi:hypothetical protein
VRLRVESQRDFSPSGRNMRLKRPPAVSTA